MATTRIMPLHIGKGRTAVSYTHLDVYKRQSEYTQLKELLTPEEYAAARSSTLNAHYTSPTVIQAIYEAVGRMGFELSLIHIFLKQWPPIRTAIFLPIIRKSPFVRA